MPLNDIIDTKAPNYKSVIESDSYLEKLIKTDEGQYYVFANVRDDDLMHQKAGGFIFRQDYLDKIGLEIPTSMDEWYEVLTAFKDDLGLPSPYLSPYSRLRDESAFIGAFGVFGGFYQDNNVVKYGMIESGYKDYLATMAKWYAEGLIDKDIITIDQKGVDGKFTSNQVGATYHSPDGGLGVYMQMMTKEDPSVNLQPAPYPTLHRGEIRKYAVPPAKYTYANSVAISQQCRDLDSAVKLLDYGYSDEGYMFFNFGIEGKSYNIIEGKPVFTEFITNNPDGKTFKQAMTMFCRASVGGPMVRSLAPVQAQRAFPQQNEAANLWYSSVDWSSSLPPVTLNADESEIVANIMSEVTSLVEEMTIKIFVGELSLDAYEGYVEQIKSAGIEDAISAYQSALDRFNNR